jgi:hypothetical protein
MVSKRSNIIIASVVALLCFLTLAWMSCKRTDSLSRCEGVVCQNAGVCKYDSVGNKQMPVCHCPVGWEGSDCSIVSVQKYLANWNNIQSITWSDSTRYIHDSSSYPLYLVSASTPTTFFINNFFDNSYYNNIICTLDSTNSYAFTIDTLSDFEMNFSHYHILWGQGVISPDQSTIDANMYIKYKNKSTNWEVDSISFHMIKN